MFDSDSLYGKIYEKLSFTEKICHFKKPERVLFVLHTWNTASVSSPFIR